MAGVGPSSKSHAGSTARCAGAAAPLPCHFRLADLPIELQHLVVEQARQCEARR